MKCKYIKLGISNNKRGYFLNEIGSYYFFKFTLKIYIGY